MTGSEPAAGAATACLRVTVAAGRCHGHGLCYDRYPELFSYDDEGYAVVRHDVVEGAGIERAAEAARGCPEQAIVLEDTQS